MIIAIDGPAGSGKSTTARAVADRLGYMYLDTGAMYRTVALAFIRNDVEMSSEGARRLLPDVRLDLRADADGQHMLLNADDVSDEIRTPEVTSASSVVAALPEVRAKLVGEQRRIALSYEQVGGGAVLDGRDIGTVVLPNADVKVFMIADEQVRARRRHQELKQKGVDTTVEEVLAEIRARDEKDARRAIGPLRKADDALVLDTSDLNIDEQINVVIKAVKERENLSAV